MINMSSAYYVLIVQNWISPEMINTSPAYYVLIVQNWISPEEMINM